MRATRLVQARLIVFNDFRFHPYFNVLFNKERKNYIVTSYSSFNEGTPIALHTDEKDKITRLIELFSQAIEKADEFKTQDSEIKLEFYTQDYSSSLHPPKYFYQLLKLSLGLLENSPHKNEIDVFFFLVQVKPKHNTNICTLMLRFHSQELF